MVNLLEKEHLDMKKAVVYLRKSVDIASEKSISRQRAEILEYCHAHQIEVVDEFIDEKHSGTLLLEREGFRSMLEYLEVHRDIDYIMIEKFDRITRDQWDLGWVISQLKKVMKVKTTLHSINLHEDNDYGDDPIKILMAQMRSFGAAAERQNIVERMKSGKSNKRKDPENNFIGGRIPLGYKHNPLEKKLEIEPSEVGTVRMIFELKDSGKTLRDISEYLNENGFRTKQGKEFLPMSVKRILDRKSTYMGYGAPGILTKSHEY
jgi:site-specific DNA recombinase